MKNKRKFWAAIGAAVVLLTAAGAGAAILITGQVKENGYREQMRTARQYVESMDYTKVVEAYQAAIELKPEEPEPYVELTEFYLEQEKYYEAGETAREGWNATGDQRLYNLIDQVTLSRTQAQATVQLQPYQETEDARQLQKLVLRADMVENVAWHCYQQYLDDYGEPTAEKVSDEEGYRFRFQGLNAYLYFRNTADQPAVIDERTRVPAQTAKPYKVVFPDLTSLFVGYEGSLSFDNIQAIFGVEASPVLDEETGIYRLQFEYMGCTFQMETDAQGNLSSGNQQITLLPVDLVTTDWEPEPEEEEEEEETGTFELGGNTYSYDETSISISDVALPDISELGNCKDLKELTLVNCQITDISALAGCESLEYLCLDFNPFTDISPLAGLKNLRYLQFHESGVSDISSLYDLDLEFFNPCSPGLPREQVEEYQRRHPDCICYWDYYRL